MKLTLKNLSMAIMMSTIVMGSSAMAADSNEKIVIAHRGASGYLPEHTLPAKAMAYAQGADYLEQDLVMTKDDHLVVLHDHYLDRVTDVADRFPDRARKDGRYYAIDFTLDEIKSLKFTEGFDIENGKKVQTYPGRFPMGKSDFRVHTFEEEIEFVQGLNHSTGKNIGIYPEIKAPWFHHQEGKDIAAKTEINLNSVRHTLYNLYEHRLAEYRRIKNNETGWLTYLWVMRMDNLNLVLRSEMETVVGKLSARLRYDEANDFYQCKNCGLMTTFNNACTTNFACEQCGEMLVHFDDELLVSALKSRVEKMREALSDA